MPLDALEVRIVPLVPNLELPRCASPRTRAKVPAGYGIQEQCLPFTAASGLGLLIPSPIRFGHCSVADVPAGCRAFRSPLPAPAPHTDWVFYVEDNARCNFSGNAFSLTGLPNANQVLEPGVSFFDRDDQQDLFKLHLPYVWRTPPNIDTLFLPLLNRSAQGIEVQSGLVETDWYTSPVNMILRKPPTPVHFQAGDAIAQAILIVRQHRDANLEFAAGSTLLAQEVHQGLADWYTARAADRSAYKVLARSHNGRLD